MVEKKCKQCGVIYRECPSRNLVFCSSKCQNDWRRGKTLEEIYPPEIAKRMLDNLRTVSIGNRYRRGKKHSKESIEKMRIAQKGRVSPRRGVKLSKEIREKISRSRRGQTAWNKGKPWSAESRHKMRLSKLKYMEKQSPTGIVKPTIGRHETQVLDKLEEWFGFKILRQHKIRGYFLDGFCPALNTAIEIDEPQHKYKTEKDIHRQSEIESHLGCRFIRIQMPIAMET